MKISAQISSLKRTNTPKVAFTGRSYQVKRLLDTMAEVNRLSENQMRTPSKFTQEMTRAMKKLDIF